MISLQAELFKYLEETNQNWSTRMQSEAAMVSEFATKLASARSFSETAAACQEWTDRHIELLAKDSQHLFADTKKLMEAGAQVLANSWAGRPDVSR